MLRKIAMLIALVLLAGCTPHPRYRADAEGQPAGQMRQNVRYTTNDYIRLGSIMQSYLGKPYAGKSQYEEGVDCSAFTRAVFKEFDGTLIPRMVSQQFQSGRHLSRSQIGYGDLVFFRSGSGGVSHVGIYVGFDQFIHVSSSRGVIISSMNEKHWSRRFVGARRVLVGDRAGERQP